MAGVHDCGCDCTAARELLRELLDEDTTPARAAAIRHELHECPECFSQLESELAVRGLVRDCCRQAHAPEPLRQRIITSITSITSISVTRYQL